MSFSQRLRTLAFTAGTRRRFEQSVVLATDLYNVADEAKIWTDRIAGGGRSRKKGPEMIKVTPQNNFCLVEPQGPLTKADFETIASHVDPIIESEGALDGLIIRTRDFPGWDSFSDVIEHCRFVRNHHQLIKKIALVTDARVADLFPVVVSHFVKAEGLHFAFDEYEKAVEWIG